MRNASIHLVSVLFGLGLGSQSLADPTPTTVAKFRNKTYRQHFSKFSDLVAKYPFKVQGDTSPVDFALTRIKETSSSQNIVVACNLQGRNFGCLPAINDLFEAYNAGNDLGPYVGRLSFFISNPETAKTSNPGAKDEATKSFGEGAVQSDEKARADQIKKLLNKAEVFLEISQIMGQNPEGKGESALWSFPFTSLNYLWAKYVSFTGNGLAINALVDTTNSMRPENSMSMTEYARKQGAVALSLELYPKDDSEAELELAIGKVKTVLQRILQVRSDISKSTNLRDLEEHAKDLPDFSKLYAVTQSVPFANDKLKLSEGLHNFQAIKKDQVLGADGAKNQELRSTADALLFHPRYLKIPVAPANVVPANPPPEEEDELNKPSVNLPRYIYEMVKPTTLKDLGS